MSVQPRAVSSIHFVACKPVALVTACRDHLASEVEVSSSPAEVTCEPCIARIPELIETGRHRLPTQDAEAEREGAGFSADRCPTCGSPARALMRSGGPCPDPWHYGGGSR